MEDLLRTAEIFAGLNGGDLERLSVIARKRTLMPDDYLFLLGDDASWFYIVTRGRVDLCLPMPLRGEVKDIAIESVGAGEALGWSALVKPYRFTLSARATAPSEVVGFGRRPLLELFEAEPRIGYTVLTKVSELVGIRLHTFQALWMRELQRMAERPALAQ
jgi:CRP-like cAMP-binding protein